ncbi:GNAT family N-acetyltransferase [Shewanella sp. A32]|uniref:GNAT family N-acetyltransferase n=1 Tax=Shewanella sp. A32 TaxID=3031327 RepID=UPI0023B94A3B|nr:GNAT family N-acetyltransferase [Shewanella sp. A32]MDF0534162.1 GNAT family N-acetyltransferase [Shewanella sp. A32]
MSYPVVTEIPAAEEYCRLRLDVGLSAKSTAAARIGLSHAPYTICVRDNGPLISMGRVIGDGGGFFHIVDIAVAPKYQRQGLGKLIMDKIEQYLDTVAQDGSYVSLIADKPDFYAKRGYLPTAPAGHGMYKKFQR